MIEFIFFFFFFFFLSFGFLFESDKTRPRFYPLFFNGGNLARGSRCQAEDVDSQSVGVVPNDIFHPSVVSQPFSTPP